MKFITHTTFIFVFITFFTGINNAQAYSLPSIWQNGWINNGETIVVNEDWTSVGSFTIENNIDVKVKSGGVVIHSNIKDIGKHIEAVRVISASTTLVSLSVDQEGYANFGESITNITPGHRDYFVQVKFKNTLPDNISVKAELKGRYVFGRFLVPSLRLSTFSLQTVTLTSVPLAPTCDTFAATPSVINAGQSSTLNWTTSNGNSVSISGLTGSFALDGSRTVNPIVTTTYTLTVTGANNQTATCSLTVTVLPFKSNLF